VRVLLPEITEAAKARGGPDPVARLHDVARGLGGRAAPALGALRPVQAGKASSSAWRRLERWWELRFDRPVDSGVVEKLLAREGVPCRVEPVYRHALCGEDTLLTSPILTPSQILQLEKAHAVVRAADAGIVLAVVDGGTDWRHEDLVEMVYRRPGEIEGNGIDDDGNGFVDDVHGWNFADGQADPTGLPNTPTNALHGTHIAGIACADDTNDRGIVGVSGGARLLAIDAGDPEEDRIISYGYEGLLYAALSGARVINASWGRTGRWSQYEADVLQAIEEMGSVVIAAAGNNIHDVPFYPAFYPTVLSVTSIRRNLVHNTIGANAAYWIDVSAPGVTIVSTIPGNAYDSRRGTSQAAAHASGVAALVCAMHPEWTPRQVREQIRWSAVDLSDYNDPVLFQRMGIGVVNAYRAVTRKTAGVAILDRFFTDEDGDGVVEGAEILTGGLRLSPLLGDAEDLRLELFTDDPYLVVLLKDLSIGSLRQGGFFSAPRAYKMWVTPQAPPAHMADLRIQITTAQDTVYQWIPVELRPLHIEVKGEEIVFTLAANGRLGFADLLRPGDPAGEGLHRPDQPTRMLGGSFLFGNGPTAVSDAVLRLSRSAPPGDFFPHGEEPVTSRVDDAGNQVGVVVFDDGGAPTPLRITVRVEATAFDDAARGGFCLVRYRVWSNTGAIPGARMGLLVDWASHEGVRGSDQVFVEPGNRLAYVLDVSGVDGGGGAGIVVLSGPGGFAASWLPDVAGDGWPAPGLYDVDDPSAKLTDEQLWGLLIRPSDEEPSPPGDLAQVISMGPFDLPRKEPVEWSVAWLLGDTPETIRALAETARRVEASFRGGFGGQLASRVELLPTTPNPFIVSNSGGTRVRFRLPDPAPVRLRIFDLRGRQVRVLVDGRRPAGYQDLLWDGRDDRGHGLASGVYFLSLQTPSSHVRQRMILLR